MKLTAYCRQCGHKHPIDQNPASPDNQVIDWYTKHAGHFGVGLINPQESPRRSKLLLLDGWKEAFQFKRWSVGKRILGLPARLRAFGMPVPLTQLQLLDYVSNANVNIAYAATASFTITLASLASSSGLTAGQEGTSISNSSNKYIDALISARFTTHTSAPTVSTFIECWMIAGLDDSPTWPDVFDGTDSAETVTTRNQLFTYGAPVSASILTTATSQAYDIKPVSLSGLYGGIHPRDYTPFVTQSSGQILHATAGNHFVKATGITLTVA